MPKVNHKLWSLFERVLSSDTLNRCFKTVAFCRHGGVLLHWLIPKKGQFKNRGDELLHAKKAKQQIHHATQLFLWQKKRPAKNQKLKKHYFDIRIRTAWLKGSIGGAQRAKITIENTTQRWKGRQMTKPIHWILCFLRWRLANSRNFRSLCPPFNALCNYALLPCARIALSRSARSLL